MHIFLAKNVKMGDMKILENVPLSGLTTMRLGGPARYVVEVESPDEVATITFPKSSAATPAFSNAFCAAFIAMSEVFSSGAPIWRL